LELPPECSIIEISHTGVQDPVELSGLAIKKLDNAT
jgi:hypothetical protein